MVRKIYFLAILCIAGGLVVTSCTKEEELSSKKEILSFVFEASKNSGLESIVIGDILNTDVSADVPFGTNKNSLIPTIEISPNATISPESGVEKDFSTPVTYTVTAEDGSTKEFLVTVSVEPAPYIGSWTGGPIDFGIGLVHVNMVIDADGNLTMELEEVVSHNINGASLKGHFEPTGKVGTDLLLEQTHRWINHQWREESHERTIRYEFDEQQEEMRFYYCICHPRNQWWFQLDLEKQ